MATSKETKTQTKAKTVRKPHRYAHHSKRIFGLKCSQHRTNKMRIVLKHYTKRAGANATKDVLLTRLDDLQKNIPQSDVTGIQEWFQSTSESEDALRMILGDAEDEDDAIVPERDLRLEEKVLFEAAMDFHRNGPQGPPLRECSVCAEDLPEDSFPDHKITPMCNHEPTTCRDCLTTSVATQVPESAWDSITCPECPEQLSYDAVKQWASADTFALYDKKSLMAAMNSIPGFTACLAPGCGAGQIHDGGDDEPIMTCITCRSKTCFTHKMPWHTGQTCAEYDAAQKERMEQEVASEALVTQTAKRCPNCDLAISKTSGCDHMRCSQCSFEFCYVCRASWAMILLQSNTAHDPSCMYHTRNMDRGIGVPAARPMPIAHPMPVVDRVPRVGYVPRVRRRRMAVAVEPFVRPHFGA